MTALWMIRCVHRFLFLSTTPYKVLVLWLLHQLSFCRGNSAIYQIKGLLDRYHKTLLGHAAKSSIAFQVSYQFSPYTMLPIWPSNKIAWIFPKLDVVHLSNIINYNVLLNICNFENCRMLIMTIYPWYPWSWPSVYR